MADFSNPEVVRASYNKLAEQIAAYVAKGAPPNVVGGLLDNILYTDFLEAAAADLIRGAEEVLTIYANEGDQFIACRCPLCAKRDQFIACGCPLCAKRREDRDGPATEAA
jgi:hypothetical protein